MRAFLGLIIVTLLCACGPRAYYDNPKSKAIYYIIKCHNKRLAAAGLYEFCNGGAGHPIITSIAEGYITNRYRFDSVDQARNFFCNLFDEYVRPFNEDDSIRPLVNKYPITAENLQLTLCFLSDNGSSLKAPYISSVGTDKGSIFYYVENENGHDRLIHRETYEEAKKIVESKKNE